MKITVNLIATRKYHVFVQPMIDSICRYFLVNHQVHINVFTDNLEHEYVGNYRVTITNILIESYGFPEATLFRYEIMLKAKYDCDYIFYFDVDYLIIEEIKDDILGELVGVLHPGFSHAGGGSWSTDESCYCYLPPEKRIKYFCGGTQFGTMTAYYGAMLILSSKIRSDYNKGIKAEWNDEAGWNWLLATMEGTPGIKILDSEYCFPDKKELAELWKIDHLSPKILALSKNHAEFQQA